jgi:hypothetical protein
MAIRNLRCRQKARELNPMEGAINAGQAAVEE